MAKPDIHFTREEFVRRQAQVRRRLAELGLDGLLLFKSEDMSWACGLDTDGFCIFHCMFTGAKWELTHETLPADLANIAYSSTCDDVRVWVDRQGNPKGQAIREMLER